MEFAFLIKRRLPEYGVCFSYKEKARRIWSFAFGLKGGLPEYGALLLL